MIDRIWKFLDACKVYFVSLSRYQTFSSGPTLCWAGKGYALSAPLSQDVNDVAGFMTCITKWNLHRKASNCFHLIKMGMHWCQLDSSAGDPYFLTTEKVQSFSIMWVFNALVRRHKYLSLSSTAATKHVLIELIPLFYKCIKYLLCVREVRQVLSYACCTCKHMLELVYKQAYTLNGITKSSFLRRNC